MNKKRDRLCRRAALLLLLLLALQCFAGCITGQTEPEKEKEPEKAFVVPVSEILPDGSLLLSESTQRILSRGFSYGDLLSVRIGERTVELAFVRDPEEVPQGKYCLAAQEGADTATIACPGGSFAERIGISQSPGSVALSLKEHAGYFQDWIKRLYLRSDLRGDYPGLSDEEFANFRAVKAGKIAQNTLYRSASPINPSMGRALAADEAMKNAGVRTVLNLADGPTDMTFYAGYRDRYYASLEIEALKLRMDFFTDSFTEGLANGLRFLAQHEGPYLIHCAEGKDRTGFVCAVLEALAGADEDEIVADYMLSYRNYYGITPDDPLYLPIARENVLKNLAVAFETESLEGADLSALARAYLLRIGLTQEETAALLNRLTGA